MFKFSLILLSIIIVILIGLDSNFFNEEHKKIIEIKKEEPPKASEEFIIERSTVKKEIPREVPKEIPNIKKRDIYFEIQEIIKQAETAYHEKNFEKAIALYDTIIEKSKDSQEIKILRFFAMGHFRKASIYRLSFNEEMENIIKAYDSVITKFENRQEIALLKLYARAKRFKANISERDKSLELYNDIIRKFSKSSNVELLKIYTTAQFNKSYITTGSDTLEIFNQVIENLKNQDDKELLRHLYKAQQNKAYILEQYMNQKEEAVEVYDEIIKKFSSHEGEEYRAIVDSANFQKSFLLMGQNDEGSMEIYDEIIKKYEKENQSNSNLDNLSPPLRVEYSIINNIELSLITNNDDTNYRELAEKYLSKSGDTKPQMDMLEILKNAQVSNQDEALKSWKKENKEYSFSNWSFNELEQWNAQMEEGEQKSRIKSYLHEFIKHNESNAQQGYAHSR